MAMLDARLVTAECNTLSVSIKCGYEVHPAQCKERLYRQSPMTVSNLASLVSFTALVVFKLSLWDYGGVHTEANKKVKRSGNPGGKKKASLFVGDISVQRQTRGNRGKTLGKGGLVG